LRSKTFIPDGKLRCGRARCRVRQDGRFEEEQIDYLCERQTPHRIGMFVALLDGSVRRLAPGISPTTFWAAVTPAGGEVLGSDWEVVSRDVVGTAAPIILVALRVPVTSTSVCRTEARKMTPKPK
jgi:hypothetical protein